MGDVTTAYFSWPWAVFRPAWAWAARNGDVVVELHLLVVLPGHHFVFVQGTETLVVGLGVLQGILGLLQAETSLGLPPRCQGVNGEQTLAGLHRCPSTTAMSLM
jgi:hypothetical protein